MLQIIIIALTVVFTIGNPVEDPRIIGGRPAEDGEFPYQVSLRQLNTNISHFCGGSIISTEWILTAAHCVAGKSVDNILLVAGTNSLKHGGFAYIFNKIVSHPSYVAQLKINDIALLRVKGSIILNSKVQTIALATEPAPLINVLWELSGWGLISYPSAIFPDALETTKLWAMDLQRCQEKLPEYRLFDTNSCAHYSSAYKGSCEGDSGGPVIYESTQIAVVSWNIPCAKGKPDVFTDIHFYRTWIKQVSGV